MNQFLAAGLLLTLPVLAQGPPGGGRGGRGGPPPTPKASASIDMTGTWVSVVTEDWKFRMVTPPKGEFGGVPVSGAGRAAAMAWDPDKDTAAGNACKSYGAAGIMRVPGRLKISWEDDRTMKIETEAGTQTRLFHFGGMAPANTESSWQGYSTAQWEQAVIDSGQPRMGDLKISTSHIKAGYLRKNGVPYGDNASLTEYYDRHTAPNGDIWLVVTTEVLDPQYLTEHFVTSTHFKKIPDNSPWRPEPCAAK